MKLIASAPLTGGAFELVEEVRAAESGPTPHVHRERDEGFYVLESRYTFVREHDEIDASPGDFIFIPRGTRHAFRALDGSLPHVDPDRAPPGSRGSSG